MQTHTQRNLYIFVNVVWPQIGCYIIYSKSNAERFWFFRKHDVSGYLTAADRHSAFSLLELNSKSRTAKALFSLSGMFCTIIRLTESAMATRGLQYGGSRTPLVPATF